MIRMPRKAVPFTPFEGEFRKNVVSLASNVEVHFKEGKAFAPEG
mgnify:CR=1 FL=1